MHVSAARLLAGVLVLGLAACGQQTTSETPADPAAEPAMAAEASAPEASQFTVLVGGTEIGGMTVSATEDGYTVDFEYRNNGRGPTLAEDVGLDEAGLPTRWNITGSTTFGNQVDERFEYVDSEASWTDATGSNQVLPAEPAFYVPQDTSPYWLAIAARALMDAENATLPALPGGELRLTEIDQVTVSNGDTSRDASVYALSGISLNPTYFLMDGRAFVALITPGFTVIEAGYEGEDERLRGLAAEYGASRFADITARVSHNFDGPVRIRNVRVFDPATEALGEPVSVVFDGNRITAIEAADAEPASGETVIEGDGGSLIPGFTDMHAHLGEQSALLNIAAGVTSVRDMGNNNDVLSALIGRIESGQIAGPRVTRSGFIEGRSPFSSNNGILVETEEEAVAAVETYAASGDFVQIKIYNSMNPDWVPAMIEAARARGLRVAGHVPAFTNADAMIAAGYDELTHINQIMLGWVLEPGEDTRTLLRLTALRRLPALDLQSAPVQATLDAMAERGIAHDPTLAIHEALLLSRNGEVSPGTVDYIDHMPIDAQRSARSAWADIATPEDDANYRGAFDQIIATARMMHERGIFLVPGTDMGGSFTLHRELELYQMVGMTPGEVLAWATQGMADYLGRGDELGSIEPGKLADFFLVPGDPTANLREIKTISMVVADGRVYFPTEIYPEFGIRPFTGVPEVTTAE